MTADGTAPPMATAIDEPARLRSSGADRAAVAVMWVGLVVGIVSKFAFGGWGLFLVVVTSPISIGLLVVGAAFATHALLGTRSASRRRHPALPSRYRAGAWTLGLGALVAGGVVPDVGDVGDPQSGLGWVLGLDQAPELTALAGLAWLVAAAAAIAAIVVCLGDWRALRGEAATARG